MNPVAELLEESLVAWAKLDGMRDELIRASYSAGVSKHRIHTITGLARTTVDRILHSGQSTVDSST